MQEINATKIVTLAAQRRDQLTAAAETAQTRAQSDASPYWRAVFAAVHSETVERLGLLEAVLAKHIAGDEKARSQLIECLA